jgi:rod shape-determining protein MreD
MRRAVICAVLPLVVVLLQVMVVDRLPLPGGSVPDIGLIVVVALGLTQGPLTGTITGFLTGLDLDLVPPGGHLIGESALIFCLTGYACGGFGIWLERAAPRLLAAALIGVGAGEALQEAAGIIAGDPGVTLSAVRQVLPVTVLYDVLLCPMVLFLAALAIRRSAVRQRPAVRQLTARQARQLRAAQPAGMRTATGSVLPASSVRNDVGRLAPIRPPGTRGLFRRRVRICRQVPRWPGDRPAVPGALAGRTGRIGRTP